MRTTISPWFSPASHAGSRSGDLSAPAIAAAKANVFDTLACAVAGSGARGVAEARELAVEWAGAPQATILAFGDKVPAHHAAWVNGTMAHARDYDDTHDAAILHAGVSVVPAALAAAELRHGARGGDFIAAVAAGLETICRLGVATRSASSRAAGCTRRSSVTLPRLSRRDACSGSTSRRWSMRSASCTRRSPGNHQVTRDGALTKRMQPGFAAQAALVSVQLARRGVRGAQATFEGADGFLRVYLRDRCDRDVLRKGLGEHYEFTQLSYKPYPCCRFNHTAIDAALALRASAGVSAERVRRIRVGVNRQAYEAVATPIDVRKAPATIVHAQFSLPFTVATALVDGRVELRHFTEASIRREDILALAQRVDVFVDDDIDREWGRNVSPAELHRRDGRRDDAQPARGLAARSSAPADVGLGLRRQGHRLLSRVATALAGGFAPPTARAWSTLSSRSTTFARSCSVLAVRIVTRAAFPPAKETK